MNVLVTLFVLFLSVCVHAEQWDYQERVQYQENHDPSVIWLQDGRKLSVNYDAISWEEVDAWPANKTITLGYRVGLGTVLFDPVSKKQIHVIAGLDKHPLDTLTEQCLEKAYSTLDMAQCYQSARINWDKELNAHYARLMSMLNKEDKGLLEDSQRAWVLFRDAQVKSIRAVYDRDGSVWGLVIAEKEIELTKEQALRLNALSAF